jgi:AhpD family alkylhydroperoxidase
VRDWPAAASFEAYSRTAVSKVSASAFCIGAHTATARRAYENRPLVEAVLADLESAPIAEPLRATLRMLGTLTADGKLGPGDMRAVLATGVSREQVKRGYR